ncbi:MAG: cache domain-containing protein [Pseudomonadota bacterium]
MHILFKTILSGAALLGLAGPANAVDKATAEDAVALVKKAIAYQKENGTEKMLAEVSNPKGLFVRKDTYVVVHDLDVKVLAHGVNPRLIGVNSLEMKDVEGKPFGKLFGQVAKGSGPAWIDYKFPNPASKAIEAKSAYVEKSGDMIFSAGVYK